MKALLTLFLLAVVCVRGQAIVIPAWVNIEVSKAYGRFIEWKGDDEVVVFPVTTDLHSGGRDTYKHIAYVNHAGKTFPFDLTVDLGDIGLDVPATRDPEVAKSFLARHGRLRHEFPGVALQVVGNHDHNRVAGNGKWITDKQIAEVCNLPNLKKGHKVVFAEDATYGYYDIPRAKVRIVFLNTSDHDDAGGGYYVMATKQLQWLADNLKFSEPGWTVVALTHYCVKDFGNWVGSKSSLTNGDVLVKIYEDFVAGKAGELKGVKWDFTANEDCRFAVNLIGDSHFDASETTNGVNYVITQGYGGVSEKDFPAGRAVKTPFNYRTMMLVDIVVVKPAKRELKLIRMGAGGKARDRVFKW